MGRAVGRNSFRYQRDQASVPGGLRTSVIVPIYNEVDLVADLVRHLSSLDACEIVVVDGGSSDGTWQRLQELETSALDCRRAQTGRAAQMNSGALRSTGELLLFLHADTRLPHGALKAVTDGLRRHPACRWGRFDVRFDRAGTLLKIVARSMNLRSAWTSICTGDQAIFVYREEFLDVGGFPPAALMEDIELSRRLKHRSRALRIRAPATTSSRRWLARGTVRTITWMWWLRWLYWWGVPASALAARYHGKPR